MKKCKLCRMKFEPNSNRQEYCSKSCRRKNEYIRNIEYYKNYQKTINGKENHKKRQKKYLNTSKGRTYKRNYDRKRKYIKRKIIEKFTFQQWERLKQSTNGICPNCNIFVGIDNLTLDHIYPIIKAELGRIYTINDVQPLCRSCNSSKGGCL